MVASFFVGIIKKRRKILINPAEVAQSLINPNFVWNHSLPDSTAQKYDNLLCIV